MKKLTLLVLLLAAAYSGCKKDTPPPPENQDRKPDVLIKSITESLAKADSISTFTNALKTLSLTAEETAQGITVFAPLNQDANLQARQSNIQGKLSSTQGKLSSINLNKTSEINNTPITLVDSVLKDHIVKGVLKLTDLTDGKVLTGLSGKQLKVTRNADTIWINGVQIGGKQIVSTNNEVVYVVKTVLTGTKVTDDLQSTTLEITVWDGSKWSTAKPKGEVASGATVVLYSSQQKYADSVLSYQGTTDITGKVSFKFITPGTYYIKVSSGNKSNIFNRSPKQNGLYLGFASAGIFQNVAEVTAAPAQPGAAPGNFKWLDANQDGIINDNDRVTLPYEKAVAVNGILKKTEISIGSYIITEPKLTEQEFLTTFTNTKNNIATWQRSLVVVDGLLSRDAVIDSIPLAFKTSHLAIGNYSFAPTNQVITQLWQNAYQAIASLSTLEERAPAVMNSRAEKLAVLKAERAYIYLQLLSYFGNIPLLKEAGKLTNNDRTSVYTYITSQLHSAANALPNSTTSKLELNAISTKVLQAKAALLDKQYEKVASLTDSVINSATYLLESPNNRYIATSKEIIWNNATNFDLNTQNYFYSRPTLPYIRLTEVYLMNIEANLNLGNTPAAQNRYITLLNRYQLPQENVSLSKLRNMWGWEMRREGLTFLNLLRWGTAAQTLGSKGFVASKHSRLPIPQSALDQNPGLLQNPGY